MDLACGPGFEGHASDTCSCYFAISVPARPTQRVSDINDGICMYWVTLPAGTLQRHQQYAAAGVTTAAVS